MTGDETAGKYVYNCVMDICKNKSEREWIGDWFRKVEDNSPPMGRLETAHISCAIVTAYDFCGDLFSDEEKELIDDGQISSYKVYKDHHKKEGNTSLKDDDLTDSLEDDSGNPAPILIRERKKSSKSKYEEEQEKRDAKKVAENRAYIKGLVRSCVTFILGKVEEGFSSNEIEQDEEVKQLLENPFDFRFRKETNND